MTLPTPESLLPGLAAVEQALAQLESQLAGHTFTATSSDTTITAKANGMLEMSSLDIAASQLSLDPAALAGKVLVTAGQALAAALADSAHSAFVAGSSAVTPPGYNLPGVPSVSSPPLTDNGFDRVVGGIRASEPTIADAIRKQLFTGQDGVVTARVDGTLVLRSLAFDTPLPGDVTTLALATISAINIAIVKAKQLFEDTTSTITDDTSPRPRLADTRPRALLVVENASTLRASDEALRARLTSLGFNVDVGKAPSVVSSDAYGRALVLVSESVAPADVTTKFTNAVVPMVVCEPVQFKDLKMTGTVSGTDEGETASQTKLQVTAGHPLAAGLSGQVTVTKASAKFEWGAPAATAIKVASIVGASTHWGIFAYDTGDAMVGMNAPARRVGFFAGQDTPAQLTDAGWSLFDAAVRWATAAKALLTVKTASPLAAGDAALKSRLEVRHGLEVLVRLETDTKTSDLFDFRVHVIAESISSTNVAARYLSSPAPTLVLEANLFDDMKMTGAVSNTDFGQIDGLSSMDIVSTHPLAAGLTGTITAVASPQPFGWGLPGAEAFKVARLVGRTDAHTIFAYEGGANMVGARATAPRVGFFSAGNAPANFTPDGQALFDAAITWARAPRALLIVKDSPPRADDEILRQRLQDSFGFVVDVKTAVEVVAAHANGHHVVVVSESIGSSDLGSKLTNVAVPIVSMEPAVFDDLKMTGTTSNTDFGAVTNQSDLDFAKVDHPLAAGQALGRVTVVTAPSRFIWGLPAVAAVKIARIVGNASAWGIFGYETGATMVGINAPARRVGFFLGENSSANLNETGKRLFDAAVLWAAGRIEVRPGVLDVGTVVRDTPPDTGGTVIIPPTLPPWQVGVAYKVGDKVTFQGLDYQCRQAHTSQSDWIPPNVYALWARINAGATWATQVLYAVGETVSFSGHHYRCIQAHQSQPDWTPPVVPALWQKLD